MKKRMNRQGRWVKAATTAVVWLFLVNSLTFAGDGSALRPGRVHQLSPALLFANEEYRVRFQASLICKLIEKRADYGKSPESIYLDDILLWQNSSEGAFKGCEFEALPGEFRIYLPGRKLCVRYYDSNKNEPYMPYADVTGEKTDAVFGRLKRQIVYLVEALPASVQEDNFSDLVEEAATVLAARRDVSRWVVLNRKIKGEWEEYISNVFLESDTSEQRINFLRILTSYLKNEIPEAYLFDGLGPHLLPVLTELTVRFHLWNDKAISDVAVYLESAAERVRAETGKDPVVIELFAGYGDLSFGLSKRFPGMRIIPTDGFSRSGINMPGSETGFYDPGVVDGRRVKRLLAEDIVTGKFRELLDIPGDTGVIVIGTHPPLGSGVEKALLKQTRVDEMLLIHTRRKGVDSRRMSGDPDVLPNREVWDFDFSVPDPGVWVNGLADGGSRHRIELYMLSRRPSPGQRGEVPGAVGIPTAKELLRRRVVSASDFLNCLFEHTGSHMPCATLKRIYKKTKLSKKEFQTFLKMLDLMLEYPISTEAAKDLRKAKDLFEKKFSAKFFRRELSTRDGMADVPHPEMIEQEDPRLDTGPEHRAVEDSYKEFMKGNENLLLTLLADSRDAILLRVPVELVESAMEERKYRYIEGVRVEARDRGDPGVEDLLRAFQKAPNVYVELYSPAGELDDAAYRKCGLKRQLPSGHFMRTRKNTITLFAVPEDRQVSRTALRTCLGDVDLKPTDTILSPVGADLDQAGVIRGAVFGLRLLHIARQKDELERVDESFVRETVDQYRHLCESQGCTGFDLTASDIVDIASGDINQLARALTKLIKLLPIEPIDIEELKNIFKHAEKVLIAA